MSVALDTCSRCGDCLSACKEKLSPITLAELIVAGQDGQALQYGLDHCTGCGDCQVACPSELPLATLLIDSLNAHEQARWQALNANTWRERHQWREARLIRAKQDRAERLAAKAVNKLDDPHFAAPDKQARIEAAISRAAEQTPSLTATDDSQHSSDALDQAKRARIHAIMAKAQAKREGTPATAVSEPAEPAHPVTPAINAKHAKIAEAMAKAAALRAEQNKPT
ncbi:4Fe-4S dicluster domain-containing protein [Burkholderiaceae bacterium DAT-1]|nr:4Fe-4S dicluster domain-containing protein [Burkholderiaceae bacterium DAT-1]